MTDTQAHRPEPAESIRKQVGQHQPKRPLELAWELRQRTLALTGGTWPRNDDHDRIRKVVGGPQPE
ncbi:hypothetical protein GQ464_012225 [Rhodocaloribacter litoris]|uniref:hypothetical protein n=1 Tax=Rhodocaloribacter litoris TaxID=2558931 RepID=UPI00141DDE3A|nr:hypothetical protein [Rhodocaloribacter litoris]QXD14213.1 hypothetical protein GQ464_012225 [Rhodocaloribacter litoris]GIV59912.1 MAG: hypothetical protein KatS3mg043_1001 [Rhodothermaceae bacterium]